MWFLQSRYFTLVLIALVYSRGWFRLRRAFPNAIRRGVAALWLDCFCVDRHRFSSPALDDDCSRSYGANVLLMAVSPLILSSAGPAVPHGSAAVRSRHSGLVLRWPPCMRWDASHSSVFAWLAAMVALIVWHFRRVQLGLRSARGNEFSTHAFSPRTPLLVASVQPAMSRGASLAHSSVPISATLPCDALSAFSRFVIAWSTVLT